MAEATYIKKIKLRAEHVDFRRKLRLSSLLTFFQECCIAHTEELGMGRKMTLDRGFLWVITSERFLISRLPEYDEEITLECYPGPMLHYFFPRHLIVKDSRGETIIKGNALWALIDERRRELIDPKENGIRVEGKDHGDEIVPAMMIPTPALSQTKTLKADYSLVDINGHLNNASYVNLALDLLSPEELRHDIKEIDLLFKKEIPFGETFDICFGADKETRYFSAKDHFILKLVLS